MEESRGLEGLRRFLRQEGVPKRVYAARIIAVSADLLQIVFFPAFLEGFASPIDDVLDVAVGASMVALLGWHWAFLPAFLAEVVPAFDLVPTWTAAVLLVTGGMKVEPPPPK